MLNQGCGIVLVTALIVAGTYVGDFEAAAPVQAQVNVSDAAKKASGSVKSSLQGVQASGVKKLPMDVWLDPNGYIRKVSYQEHAGRQQAAKVTMQLHDFGSRVAIAPPPSDSVADLTQLQGS